MRINLTDYDSDIVYKALIKCKESAPIFAGQIGNSYLQRLANRFKVNDLAAPDHKQEHNLANPSPHQPTWYKSR